MGIFRSTLHEKRLESLDAFSLLPKFPESCDSFEDFLNFCKPHEGEPFVITVDKAGKEGFRSVERFYFFGKISIKDGSFFGFACFTPRMLNTYVPFFFHELSYLDIGMNDDLPYECKIVSVSFDVKTFESMFMEHYCPYSSRVLENKEHDVYMLTMVGYINSLLESLNSYTFSSITAEVKKILSELMKKDIEEKDANNTQEINS